MHKTYLYFIAVVVFFVLAFTGCKSSETATKASTAIARVNKMDFFDQYLTSLPNFHYLNARLNVNIETEKKELSSRVDLKMIRNEAFQLSVQPFLGYEVFRIIFTTDRMLIIDRLNKWYVDEDYATLKEKLPVGLNFYSLQALFTNQLFLPDSKDINLRDAKSFDMHIGERAYELSAKDALDFHYRFFVDNEEKLLSTQLSDKSSRYQLFWNYRSFETFTRNSLFPKQMNVNLMFNGMSKGKLDINYAKMDTGGAVEIDFTIPRKYERVPYEIIIKSLTGL